MASYIIPNRPFSRWPGNPCRWCILLLVSTCITCIRNPRFYITRGDGCKYPSGLIFDHFLGKPKEKKKKAATQSKAGEGNGTDIASGWVGREEPGCLGWNGISCASSPRLHNRTTKKARPVRDAHEAFDEPAEPRPSFSHHLIISTCPEPCFLR